MKSIEAIVVIVIFLIIAGLIQGTFWLLGFLLARPFLILLAAVAGIFFKVGKEYERQTDEQEG